MAKGTITLFEEFSLSIANGVHDIDNDQIRVMLINNTIIPYTAIATPDASDFTEVVGSNYSGGGIILTKTWTELNGLASFKVTNSPTWLQHATGPTDIFYAIIYNNTYAGANGDAIGFIDLTDDGGITPISLVDGDIVLSFDTDGLFTLG